MPCLSIKAFNKRELDEKAVSISSYVVHFLCTYIYIYIFYFIFFNFK